MISWYTARKERLTDHIWQHAQELLTVGIVPVLEIGLIRKAERNPIYRRAQKADIALRIVVLGRAT